MNLNEIHIRDPFILADDGKYYLYGTRCGGPGPGFDVYTSPDLIDWDGPFSAFERPSDFWATHHFWAPEVHAYNGAYYMLASFKSDTHCRGTQILRADTPLGPFVVHSPKPITPADWECLDGTLFVDGGKPYMVFCHEWLQITDGTINAVQMNDTLTEAVGEPFLLFSGSSPSWAIPGAANYVTDGPFLHRTADGNLLLLWSSFSHDGYCEGIAYSENGRLCGKWIQDDRLLFERDGGHGMIFRTHDGELKFVLHQPNRSPDERPQLYTLEERNDSLYLK